ncbi:MAG: hypothetical protein PHN51_10370 [Candidatus Nanopelagicales bacterium]|nr:hypothetical protein [Candidatus Nanopelagicales bacterium]
MYNFAALSDQGWVEDSQSTLSHLFMCYMLTDAAQSLLFQNNLISLPNTYHQFINDPAGMATQVATDLRRLLSRHFAQAEATARAVEITPRYYAVLMSAVVMTEKGEQLQLSKVMEIQGDDLRNIIDASNYGDGERILSDIALRRS